MKHITYCYGPINIAPGQNIIKLRTAVDTVGEKLWPQQPGYITRFDPEFVYANSQTRICDGPEGRRAPPPPRRLGRQPCRR